MSRSAMQSPLHAFGLAAEAKAVDASCGVWASEIPLLGYVSLRGNAGDATFIEAASRVLGAALPTTPCAFTQSATAKLLWLSPDEWMVVCSRSGLQGLLRDLNQALSGARHQVVDNSGGYTQVYVQGRHARDLLSHATVYDVAALDHGRVVGTTFGKSSVYLHRQGDGYLLLLRRSFADYIWRYLVRAAQPYGLGIARLDPEAANAAGSGA